MYENYAKLRDEKGLKDYEVAKLSGVATATLSSWKNGHYTPKVPKLRKIASALGVTIDDLIKEED
jgi:transcriptional regulator with XRE-family HTH domain